MESFRRIMDIIGTSVDGVGVLIVVGGAIVATLSLARRLRDPAHRAGSYYVTYRQDVGRAILLGLEFLIAGDLIRSVLDAAKIQNGAVRGLSVLMHADISLRRQ